MTQQCHANTIMFEASNEYRHVVWSESPRRSINHTVILLQEDHYIREPVLICGPHCPRLYSNIKWRKHEPTCSDLDRRNVLRKNEKYDGKKLPYEPGRDEVSLSLLLFAESRRRGFNGVISDDVLPKCSNLRKRPMFGFLLGWSYQFSLFTRIYIFSINWKVIEVIDAHTRSESDRRQICSESALKT